MGAVGSTDTDVDHHLLNFSIPAGSIKSDNLSLGAYWTHFAPNGA